MPQKQKTFDEIIPTLPPARPVKTHNCFEHDYDGGVCLICGSCTHRDQLDAALGRDPYDDYMWDMSTDDDRGYE